MKLLTVASKVVPEKVVIELTHEEACELRDIMEEWSLEDLKPGSLRGLAQLLCSYEG